MGKLTNRSDKGVALKSPPKKRKAKPPRSPSTPIGGLIYSVHPGIAIMQKWIGDLKAKTGRSLDEWMKFIKRSGPSDEIDCREWLRAEQALGEHSARWLSHAVFGGPIGLAEDAAEGYLAIAPQYVDQMYSGAKATRRPMHDVLVQLALSLGSEVRICPCKTFVPLYRRHLFAQIKPASTKRIDLGLALGGEPFTTRLRDTGGLSNSDRITHCVAITAIADIDLQVKRWLKQAYERDGA